VTGWSKLFEGTERDQSIPRAYVEKKVVGAECCVLEYPIPDWAEELELSAQKIRIAPIAPTQ
jgi:hypothetical protein